MNTTDVLEWMIIGEKSDQSQPENKELAAAYQNLYDLAWTFFNGIVSGEIGIDQQHTYDEIALEWMPQFKQAGDKVRDLLNEVENPKDEMASFVDEDLQWHLLQMDESLSRIVCAGYDINQEDADEYFNHLAAKHPDWAQQLAQELEEEHHCCGHDHSDHHEGHCCGGHGHGDGKCCGGKGHHDKDHHCCGGKHKEGHCHCQDK